MKKVLILCIHPVNTVPGQRFRFEEFLTHLKANGYDITFSPQLSLNDKKIFHEPGHYFQKFSIVIKGIIKRLRETLTIKKYDLVFVHRQAFVLGTAWFEKKIGKKVPMIFDFDDAIWMQNVSDANKKLGFLKNSLKTAEIIQASSMVFAGNEYLAAYARQRNNNVKLVPTTIDMTVYRNTRERRQGTEPVCIGWSGSFSTIQHFKTAIPALKRIKEKYGDRVRFMIMGDGNYYCDELQTQGLPWKAATEVDDLSQIDIGIMPLPADDWAKGKCGLKGLQYMALGIPTLMSPVGVNKDIIQHGVNGFLPETENEWVDIISMLVENKEHREKVGEAGRQTVLEKYSVDAWKDKYVEYFDELTGERGG